MRVMSSTPAAKFFCSSSAMEYTCRPPPPAAAAVTRVVVASQRNLVAGNLDDANRPAGAGSPDVLRRRRHRNLSGSPRRSVIGHRFGSVTARVRGGAGARVIAEVGVLGRSGLGDAVGPHPHSVLPRDPAVLHDVAAQVEFERQLFNSLF